MGTGGCVQVGSTGSREGNQYLSPDFPSTTSASQSRTRGLHTNFHVPAGFLYKDSLNHFTMFLAAFGSSRKTDSVNRIAPPCGKRRSHAK